MRNKLTSNNKPSIILLIPIVILAVLFILQWRHTQLLNQNYIEPTQYFSQRYPKGYTTKSLSFNNQQVVLIQAQNEYSDIPPTIAPLLWIQGTSQIYEIGFTGESGSQGISNNRFYKTKVNGQDELVTEWILNWGGSGGYKGLIVWNYNNGLNPKYGYPKDFQSDRTIQLRTTDNKILAEYPVTNMNYLTNLDTLGRLYFGSFIYDLPKESHIGPHYWKLQVYRYQDGEFKKDLSWNNGEELTTKGKYSFDDQNVLFSNLLPEFRSRDEALQNCSIINSKQDTNIQSISETFDPNKLPEGQQFYPPDSKQNPWSSKRFDIDGDGINEDILTASIAMNHTPHLLRILKDGKVIFKAQGANIDGLEVTNHKGFILQETTDWNNDLIKRTRYNYDSGRFLPVWYQENCKK